MKKYVLLLMMLVLKFAAQACDACQKQQPKVLRGIAHGTGPDSNWDYVIVWSFVVITVLTLFYSVKWLLKPGEKSQDHIKQFVLIND
ncbi:hypothetical protein [Deminuibacter soli]|uniref:Cbb3-type cytochrome c oxidase subunit 3 n=1 Tax=Deminuibacter soli TaxID=2291815 RepID=A0A3E1NF14_9BACT|nr:hypothetical protein [Deminuibacter soli]RFM26467.1 hypothetical protein DXN05_19770 [Deminuibacter soli]